MGQPRLLVCRFTLWLLLITHSHMLGSKIMASCLSRVSQQEAKYSSPKRNIWH